MAEVSKWENFTKEKDKEERKAVGLDPDWDLGKFIKEGGFKNKFYGEPDIVEESNGLPVDKEGNFSAWDLLTEPEKERLLKIQMGDDYTPDKKIEYYNNVFGK